VLEFLKGVKKYSPPVTVTSNDKFKNVIRALHDEVHQLYIVEDEKVKGVISVSDVLFYFKNLSSNIRTDYQVRFKNIVKG